MPVAIASLIEGHRRTENLLLLVRGFNPSCFYAILYGALMYGEISMSPYLGYRIMAYVRILILVSFFITY